MPLIKPGSPLLAGFDLNAPFIPMPERGSTWDRTDGFASAAGKALFALQDFKSFASAAQHVVANNGLLDGVPTWMVSGFTTLFETIPSVQNGQELARGIVKGVAQTVDLALRSCATSVPIVGLIVNMGLAMWEFIDRALKSDRAERPPDQAIVYDFAADLSRGADIIELAKGDDWTQLFMPPNVQSGWAIEDIAFTPGGGKQGWQWRPSGPGALGLGGLLPGVAEELGVYQCPRKAIGFAGDDKGARPWDFYTGQGLGTAGQFTPSGRKFAAVLWQSIMKPSVAMFSIDNAAIRNAWTEYFDTMWTFAESLDVGSSSDNEQAEWSVKRACVYTRITSTQNSGPLVTNESRIAGLGTTKMRNKLGSLNYRYSDIVRYVCAVHRSRALVSLDTAVAAYVPPGAPLLKSDPGLAEAHYDGRKRILTRGVLSGIELALIPDAEYRAAVVQARLDAPQRTPTPKPGAGTPSPIDPQRTPPPQTAPPQGAPIDVPQGGGGGGLLLLAGGIMAGIAIARRKS